MRWTLATKFSAAIIGLVVLAVLSSLLAMLSIFHLGRLMQESIAEQSFVIDAEELEVALLEQRGLTLAFVRSGGDQAWLDRLETWKERFRKAHSRAQQTAETGEEIEALAELETIYQELEDKRDRAVEMFQAGDSGGAERILLGEVNPRLYDRAYEVCEEFIAASQARAGVLPAEARRYAELTTVLVACYLGLTVGLAAFLLWLFFGGVLVPLRRMAADARQFTGDGPGHTRADELSVVGGYLRSLMTDVAGTRTVLEESRRRLTAAEKLASVGRLAASVAHEIRNPLTAIKMWLFSLRRSLAGDPEADRKLAIIAEEIARLEGIVRDFLEFSRPLSVTLKPLSLRDLVEKTLDLLAPQAGQKRIDLVQAVPDDLPPVMADGERLKQVLINLLDNALDAAPEEGRVCVRAGPAHGAEGRQMVVVKVEDTGPGMPDEVRRRVFEPFFTTKEDGTGLGLCIAARIMAQLHGRLVLEPPAAEGTTFAVWVPVAEEV